MAFRAYPPSGQEAKAVIELPQQAVHTEQVDPGRREFDRQRQSVEPAADFSRPGRILIAEGERFQPIGCSRYEQLDRRERERLFCVKTSAFGRHGESGQSANPFALDAQRFAGGCQNLHPRGAGQDPVDAGGNGIDHMPRSCRV